MNLFRSEEHVKEWSLYDPISEESIMPVVDWVYVMGNKLFSKRLDSDYLDRVDSYYNDWYERLAELGRKGSFWIEES